MNEWKDMDAMELMERALGDDPVDGTYSEEVRRRLTHYDSIMRGVPGDVREDLETIKTSWPIGEIIRGTAPEQWEETFCIPPKVFPFAKAAQRLATAYLAMAAKVAI